MIIYKLLIGKAEKQLLVPNSYLNILMLNRFVRNYKICIRKDNQKFSDNSTDLFYQNIIKHHMLVFKEKFICIYDKTTSLHYITQSELNLQPETSSPSPCLSQNEKLIKQSSVLQNMMHNQKYEEQQIKYVNFGSIFTKVGLELPERSKKQIYLAQLGRYCEFNQLSSLENCIPEQCLEPQIIILRVTHPTFQQQKYNKSQNIFTKSFKKQVQNFQTDIQDQQKNSKIEQTKKSYNQQIKERDRLRTIEDIIYYVKKWRNIAQKGIDGRKLNLQEAAVYVGIPKKSLDDYFYQLRVGQKYDFDFETNHKKNISELRKFVKSKIPSRNRAKQSKQGTTSQINIHSSQQHQKKKLPQTLKQAEKKQQRNELNVNITKSQNQQIKLTRFSDSEVSQIQQDWINNYMNKSNAMLFDDEDSFFKDFKYNINDDTFKYNF